MSGLSSILSTATKSLLAEQLGVEVTGHNIANVNTQGYSRQKVNFVAELAVPSFWGPLGMGVKVEGIERAFDPFITARLNEKNSLLADYQTRAAVLEQVAAYFNETESGGLNDLFSQFFASLNDLADNPSGAGERQTVLANALTLSEAFNSRADQLVKERMMLLQEVGPTIEQINRYTAHIAELTRQIVETEANGQAANDLRDKQQLEISELAKLIGVSTYTAGDGTISISLPNGLPLVAGVQSFNLTYQVNPSDKVELIWQGPGGTSEIIPIDNLSGGKLTALLQCRDEIIPSYQQELDQLAQDFILAVNRQHSQGVGLELFSEIKGTYQVTDPALPLSAAGLPFGDQIVTGSLNISIDRDGEPLASGTIAINPSLSLNDVVTSINTHAVLGAYLTASVEDNTLKIEINFSSDSFALAGDDSQILVGLGINTLFTGSNAYTLDVNAWVLDNPNLLAAGQVDADGSHAVGDNRNALALAALEDAAVGPKKLTFSDSYQQLVMSLGLEAQNAGDQESFYQGLVEQLTQMRDAVSGVSLDEELTNLVKFQRAYQAAARLVSVADELYQTLLALRR
ncbi:MAG: flagellar hook-associated protein FlgK [Desulfobaccales bacterium]